MLFRFLITIFLASLFVLPATSQATGKNYISSIKTQIYHDYRGMFHAASGILPYPFITPGSVYSNDLWDWDSWLSNIALEQIIADQGTKADRDSISAYSKGCIKNFLHYTTREGYMPIVVLGKINPLNDLPDIYNTNMHKPVLAQHAAFIVKSEKGDAQWLAADFNKLQAFMQFYRSHSYHAATGLYFWKNDLAVGVDTDPAVFFRPLGSSGNIYLNCLMYKELLAMSYLSQQLNKPGEGKQYQAWADSLKIAVQKHCWDEKDGFFYSVDLNLLPFMDTTQNLSGLHIVLHQNFPRNYPCLIQRLGVWTGFMALWAGIATPAQAKRIVSENYYNKKTFNAPYGIRTLAKTEKMYSVAATHNPSNWMGPIWIISNYMVYQGLLKYGFMEEARQMVVKTINLLGKDAVTEHSFYEYYDPETGAHIINKGFQNWNYLVLNMIAWLEKRKTVREF